MILSRVLCRDDHKRRTERIGLIVERNLRLTHRLQQAALSLRRRTIDFIRQDYIRENGSGDELKRLLLSIENRHAHNVRRQQIACKLNALERAVQRSCKAVSQRGFADSRNIFEKEMPASEQCDEAHLNDMGFPFDHSSNVLLNGPDGLRRSHDGISVWNTGEVRGDRTRSKSSKGPEDGQ